MGHSVASRFILFESPFDPITVGIRCEWMKKSMPSEYSELRDVASNVWNVNGSGESATKIFRQSENVLSYWQLFTCRLL